MTASRPKLPSVREFAAKLNPDSPVIQDPPKVLVCLDPGETTGMAIFKGPSLYHHGQLATKELDQGIHAFNELIQSQTLRLAVAESSGVHVIIEDYKVYGWKTEQHTWAELHTPKLIGALIAVCVLNSLPYSLQMAVQAKQFCTDDKLESWGLYKSGMRHARDAIRHGVSFTLFDKSHLPDNGKK